MNRVQLYEPKSTGSKPDLSVVFGLVRIAGGGMLFLLTVGILLFTLFTEGKSKGIMDQGVLWLQTLGILCALYGIAFALRGVLNGVERLVRK